MNIGIYKILNRKNNKVYIGSSIVLNKRKYKHFWMLRKGIHPNVYLQKSYNKNGEDTFDFQIIELCEEKDLILRENHYITEYRANEMDFGYNLALVSDSRRNILSDEVKMKLSKHNQIKNGNFSKFSLTNITSGEIFIFDTLIDGANYLIKNGFANGQSKNVRMTISNCLRGVKVNNGHATGSVRKTIYKHLAKVIN
jgi:subtilase family serine protease